uniref:BPTI/Kunitz inhibitor domain-containing protein n=1 Tax=Equus asinus TaxID=9793 RepID=A0A9L0IWM8_EQUAS
VNSLGAIVLWVCMCVSNLKQETPQEMTPTLPALCQLPSVRGPCKGYFHQYFYSSTSNECEHFIYGGCQGNANNFETTEICLWVCKPPETRRPLGW